MSGNPLRRPSHLEGASAIAENGMAPVRSEWPAPGYPHSLPLDLAANSETISDRRAIRGPPPGDRSTPAKVAIPRTTRPLNATTSGRVGRACENCREQKAKCSGQRPCQRCHDNGVQCSYSDRKCEKTQKQVEDLTAQVQMYEALVRDLYPKLDAESAQLVDLTLGGRLARGAALSALKPTGTAHPGITIGHTEEDFNRDEKVQAMGFVGDHSEIAWLYELKRDLDHGHVRAGENPCRPPISSLNYFQDDLDFPGLEDDPLPQPPQHIEAQLVDNYFQAVHPAFPIIGKVFFFSQYRYFCANQNVRPGDRWIAILNLVFAIAAKHSILVKNQHDETCYSHTAYFARAWKSSMGAASLEDHPNLQQVQVEGLAAFYLLSIGQVNRSWRILGMAIRSAVSMGLNLRSGTDSVAEVSKETRYRVWWALFVLDTVLCEITGRSPSTQDSFCTTPLPIPYKEENFGDKWVRQLIADQDVRNSLVTSLLSSNEATPDTEDPKRGARPVKPANDQIIMTETLTPNTSLHLLYVVDLAFLTREVIETLYAPGAAQRSWPEVEFAISNFNNTADNWLSRLPAEFHFEQSGKVLPFARQRSILGFRFYATKLLISQPCLRRLAYPITGAGPPSAFCGLMAKICVRKAGQMLSLLPDRPSTLWIYEISPWWCMLHYIMQASTILLIELFTRTQPGTAEATDLVGNLEKAILWLRRKSVHDPSSEKAWHVCVDILSKHGGHFGFKIDVEL
ncbi:transcriptional regulator family: Fungal Specific TF [Penicillium macrosclerotiorum]|uniref:transcriptional regulator family: Fungal Specific TF n=1 Tax=Penicillium macrosclerotiorum TaxID=303699 RepID=UPI002547582F|nr:transcriptional regulator family: Fungal Specific TF [Penicillium macrosclerotiorum]KAJ5674224.1 transcriptional regulator family: Fungal Specific TF [Penicillium macrosclerotiorum]